ncbi:hypothetical protein, partial [Pseudomonas lundensis]|uniref:hypothetical protein n=1 Tax=Pseudomonas lundensis TaxID=86185 RepID=UPI001CB72174
ALIFGEDICNQIPGCVGEFIPLCHLGLLALMAVYFTENRISWVYVQSLRRISPLKPAFSRLFFAPEKKCPARLAITADTHKRRKEYASVH